MGGNFELFVQDAMRGGPLPVYSCCLNITIHQFFVHDDSVPQCLRTCNARDYAQALLFLCEHHFCVSVELIWLLLAHAHVQVQA